MAGQDFPLALDFPPPLPVPPQRARFPSRISSSYRPPLVFAASSAPLGLGFLFLPPSAAPLRSPKIIQTSEELVNCGAVLLKDGLVL
ncbi:uncharacterized protein LOC133921842 isoform X2 [Phragmites australis]|uniref:uncharacterized protein LOC133921842 isoform X2 n=1 Tax=Phragmites australis TaxID=29695 RepID=UPI002D78DBB1|nr:uncharacterized protein LOC133921842 isoform X2 [Phragmites australis]